MTTSEPAYSQTEPIFFHSIRIERFRGFNKSQEIPLDASAVVISGANGLGKTSLFDAIQWLVLGRIERLEKLRFRQNEEHIVNRYAPAGSLARVEAKLKGASSGNWATVIRSGNYRSSTLEVKLNGEVKVGKAAERWLRTELGTYTLEEDVFKQSFMSTALLQQDLVREFLSSYTHAQRFEILSRLLGLSTIDEFVDKLADSEQRIGERLKVAHTELAEAEKATQELEQDLKESSLRIKTAPILVDATRALEDKTTELGFDFLLESGQDSADLRLKSILRDATQYRSLLKRLDELTEITRLHFDKKPSVTLTEIEEHVSKIQQELETEKSLLKDDLAEEQRLQAALNKIKSRTDNLRQLAIAAIPILSEQCPVCSQKIDTERVRNYLQSLLSEQPNLLKAQAAHEKIQKSIAERQRKISQIEVKHGEIIASMQSVESWQVRANSLFNELRELGQSLKKIGFQETMLEFTSIVERLPLIREWSLKCSTELQTVQELAERAVAAQSVSEESSRFQRIKSEQTYLLQKYDEKHRALEKVKEAHNKRKRLVELARTKSTEVVKEAFDELEPLTQDLFYRLAPHPTFTRLSFSHEVYRRRGSSIPQATDPQSNLEISPAVGFSSAQANVAALCYFLALAFASSQTDFRFVLLDDPLQSLDDVNTLGFSDLCRFLRKEKQLIIATHEERLGNLLVRKLTPRDEDMHTLEVRFLSWNREGPYLRTNRVEMYRTTPILTDLASIP